MFYQDISDEKEDEDFQRKRLEFGIKEAQWIVWRVCVLASSGGPGRRKLDKASELIPSTPEEEEALLRKVQERLRRRRKRHADLCMAHRHQLEGKSRTVLEAVEEETINWVSNVEDGTQNLTR